MHSHCGEMGLSPAGDSLRNYVEHTLEFSNWVIYSLLPELHCLSTTLGASPARHLLPGLQKTASG